MQVFDLKWKIFALGAIVVAGIFLFLEVEYRTVWIALETGACGFILGNFKGQSAALKAMRGERVGG